MNNIAIATQNDLSTWKLWLYTNFDCNLRCAYCVSESSPRAPRRALGLPVVRQPAANRSCSMTSPICWPTPRRDCAPRC